jgi:hypothetical protein
MDGDAQELRIHSHTTKSWECDKLKTEGHPLNVMSSEFCNSVSTGVCNEDHVVRSVGGA